MLVVPQADVGSLGLKGLGLFSNVLAALSADNVTPMAMILMEQLGAAFHTNGKIASTVPELLTRSSSRPLGRLTLAAGWRRGDSISFLAESAGGQAIALLSVCITNLYRPEAAGDILARLCHKLLPKSSPSAGITHLADVSSLVASKMNRLGFGNVLAEQTVRVMSAYEQLGVDAPQDLIVPPVVESIVDIFECLSRLREEGTFVRFTGSSGMLIILAIVIVMFPLDAIATVESFVIHQGSRNRVIIEICASEPVQIQVEKEISQEPVLKLPIKASGPHDKIAGTVTYTWDGWLARNLQLEFSRFGAVCTKRVLVACSTMITHLAPQFLVTAFIRDETGAERDGVVGLLGQYSRSRMEHICQAVLLEGPEQSGTDFQEAWAKFTTDLELALQQVTCLCSGKAAQSAALSTGWTQPMRGKQRRCPRHELWEITGRALTAGLYCLLVNSHGPVAVPGRLPPNALTMLISDMWPIGAHSSLFYPEAKAVFDEMLHMFSLRTSGSVGRSSGACTIFPSVLETFEINLDEGFWFELCDGAFVFDDRYYYILSSDASVRPTARQSLSTRSPVIIPSSDGEHSAMTVTLREGYNQLLIQVSVYTVGSYVPVDITSIILGYIDLRRTRECEHRSDRPLSEEYRKEVIITGVNRPKPRTSKLALAMVRSNPVAQFLCCEKDARSMLLQGCCLDCGVQQAFDKGYQVLIVA